MRPCGLGTCLCMKTKSYNYNYYRCYEMFNMEPTQLNMLKCQNLAYQFVAYIKPGIQKAQPGGETQCPQLAYV